MDLPFLGVHKLLLEGAFGGQLQRSKKVLLSTLVQVFAIVDSGHALLLFEGQILLNLFGHLKTTEDSFRALAIDSLVMVKVLRVFFRGDRQISLSP